MRTLFPLWAPAAAPISPADTVAAPLTLRLLNASGQPVRHFNRD